MDGVMREAGGMPRLTHQPPRRDGLPNRPGPASLARAECAVCRAWEGGEGEGPKAAGGGSRRAKMRGRCGGGVSMPSVRTHALARVAFTLDTK